MTNEIKQEHEYIEENLSIWGGMPTLADGLTAHEHRGELLLKLKAVYECCKFTRYPPLHVIDVDMDKLEDIIKDFS